MPEYISNNVNALRIKKELTQEELAEEVGVSRQTIIAIEKGNYSPSVLLALKIAAVFRQPLEKVFWISRKRS